MRLPFRDARREIRIGGLEFLEGHDGIVRGQRVTPRGWTMELFAAVYTVSGPQGWAYFSCGAEAHEIRVTLTGRRL